jgi:hypothetical protein
MVTWTRSSFLVSLLVPASVGALAACSSSSSTGGPSGGDAGSDATASDSPSSDSRAPEAAVESSTDAADSGGNDGSTDAAAQADAPQPVVIVNDAPNASMIATDGTSVYWIDWVTGDAGQQEGRVMKVAVGGGTQTALASTPGVTPASLAIDTNNVYWTASDNQLRQVSKAGDAVTSLGSGVATPVTAAGGFVYFCPQTGGGVEKVPVDGGTTTTLATSGAPANLVVVANDVFWADATGHIAYVPAGNGGTPIDLVSPDPDAGPGEYVSDTTYQNITTDGTSLYWPRAASSYPGAVLSLAVGGGSPQVVVNTGTSSPFSVATDGVSVFFLDLAATTSLVAASLGSGSTVTVTTAGLGAANIPGTPGPTVAVDSANVYWLSPPQILKIAK